MLFLVKTYNNTDLTFYELSQLLTNRCRKGNGAWHILKCNKVFKFDWSRFKKAGVLEYSCSSSILINYVHNTWLKEISLFS